MTTAVNEIRITISGCSGTGKSALAKRLQSFIKLEGIECYSLDDTEDDKYFNTFKALHSVREKNTIVTINTVQALRQSSDNMNYCVILNGRQARYANTVSKTWNIIKNRGVGDTYQVHSPTGKDVDIFTPF